MQGSPPGRRTRWFESPEVRLMSGWAFDELGLRELHAKTDGENEASLPVAPPLKIVVSQVRVWVSPSTLPPQMRASASREKRSAAVCVKPIV